MTPFGTLWQVALREIRERGRSRAYLITNLVIILFVAGLIIIPSMLAGGTDEYQVGAVGEGNDVIINAAIVLGNANDEPGDEPSVAIETVEYEDRESASEGLLAGDVQAVLINGNELLVERVSGFGGSSLTGLLQRGAATVQLETAVTEGGQAAADVVAIMTSDPLETTTLSGDGDGETAGAIAYAGLLLLYMAILLYGTWILTGVTEEKSNRVVEVLMSSVRPWQLLGGKILGIGTLGIAQFSATVIVAVVVAQSSGAFDLPPIEITSILNLIVWFVLGFLVFAVLYGGAGSLAGRMEEANNVAFPLSLLAVAGFFLSITALGDPDGVAAVIGTFIPLTAPFVVPVRASLDAIPAWQYAAAVVLTLASIVALTYVAGRIYAGALLRYGGRTKLRDAWRGSAT